VNLVKLGTLLYQSPSIGQLEDKLYAWVASHRQFFPEQDRAHVGELAQAVQEMTGQAVELAFVDQGYTGDIPAEEARQHGIQLEVIKRPEAKRGFVLLPRL
jgi:hypothetical protein